MKSTLKKTTLLCFLFTLGTAFSQSVADYDLWLSYSEITDQKLSDEYRAHTRSIAFLGNSETLTVAQEELHLGLRNMLGEASFQMDADPNRATLIVGTKDQLHATIKDRLIQDLEQVGREGFVIRTMEQKGKNVLVISANTDMGILYGVFRLLALMGQHQELDKISLVDAPQIDLRMLNHWDNLDRTVERGYAGASIWNWQKLPEYIDQRYIDYARANASIGINAVSLTNVNANALILTTMYLEKVQALAEVFRPYGIKVYLTARFSAPIEIGGLDTADPLNQNVQQWWNKKATEIYALIPDFGGFLVKANSEGQPGPQNYDRNHVDGANMMAKALKPYDGNVIWRAFVYSEHDADDRAKQAYSEFIPYDGQFMDNVLVQTKNGAIDFQPREPFHPMFGAMPKTSQIIEFQITQEYLGFSTHLVFLPKLFEEVLDSDTYRKGEGSTVAKAMDGSLYDKKMTGMVGVANIGSDLNWTGHPFAQANWYGFGRLAWNPYLDAETIADEWLRLTYSNEDAFVNPMKQLLIDSREAVVNYMNPLGLHHIFDTNHHYGPGPWVSELGRPEWNPTYYHNADENGIGFDRTIEGSNAVAQYAEPLQSRWNKPKTTPEKYLLWFHHLPWDYVLENGDTLWDGIALKYQEGVDQVGKMISTWEKMKPYVSKERHSEVQMLLNIQLKEANWWRDACLLYFQTFSNRDLPDGVEKPTQSLDYFKSLKFPFAPGIRPQWD
ncbi:alpha-glucuronidase family glycosyl hydrolase [Maribacter sp. PR1]|uniref:Xylan alpha-1,2-glucuronidase n=1 Tax=Maribacter cobaltidurans TaxID=1178778 RepID=A0ABU7IPF2_9FLAO|nr:MULTISPECIES: alpha-glucuronidase family glycosyl hydrolase [Maribacter]MDC6387443.1 alpha-glucuronidase family glycosyl hydrolase [Maribacter sp. PR1]MEE1974830.1 alpha-glucuronidase family glycosyl hydrolase [Maribacter cobaltidurans]